MSDKISLKEIADRLKVDPVTVGRLIEQKKEELHLTRHRGKRGKMFLSREDAEKLIASYEAGHGPISRTAEDVAKFNRAGWFYIAQVVPEFSPYRLKIGYADDLDQRLTEHRTAAPTVKLLKAWPCKKTWDYAAMASITREGCKLVDNEVYEGDAKGFLERAERFFALMPNPDYEIELSEYSPRHPAEEDEGKGSKKT